MNMQPLPNSDMSANSDFSVPPPNIDGFSNHVVYNNSMNMQPVSYEAPKVEGTVIEPYQPSNMANNNQMVSNVSITYSPVASVPSPMAISPNVSVIQQPQPISGNGFVRIAAPQQVNSVGIVSQQSSVIPLNQSNSDFVDVQPPQVEVRVVQQGSQQASRPVQNQHNSGETEDFGLAGGCCVGGFLCIVVGLVLGTLLFETGIGLVLYFGIPIGFLMLFIGCAFSIMERVSGRRF